MCALVRARTRVCVCVFVCVSLSLSLSVCLSVCLSLFPCFCACVCVRMPARAGVTIPLETVSTGIVTPVSKQQYCCCVRLQFRANIPGMNGPYPSHYFLTSLFEFGSLPTPRLKARMVTIITYYDHPSHYIFRDSVRIPINEIYLNHCRDSVWLEAPLGRTFSRRAQIYYKFTPKKPVSCPPATAPQHPQPTSRADSRVRLPEWQSEGTRTKHPRTPKNTLPQPRAFLPE